VRPDLQANAVEWLGAHVLAYNLKRVIAILGAQPLTQAMRA
jgi:hypothetical protein